jgi:HD superfamily phosphohydrolase
LTVSAHLPPGSANPYGPDAGSKLYSLSNEQTVRLYGPEVDIVDTAAFQRLDRIRQLGSAYLVFRSAKHTRFEHALGSVDAAQAIIDAVNRNPKGARPITGAAVRIARLAALLHDVTHVPFGHTLEDEFSLLARHDQNQARADALIWNGAIGDLLQRDLGQVDYYGRSEYELVRVALEHGGDEHALRLGDLAFVVDIVANTVCADALDYIPRDLRACGMAASIGRRFLEFFVVTGQDAPARVDRHRLALRIDKRGMPRTDVESEVVKLLEHRYELVERVFFHHAKNAGSTMLARAVELLGLTELDDNFHQLSDESLLLLLKEPAIATALGVQLKAPQQDIARARALGIALWDRRLYKLRYLGVADDDREGDARGRYDVLRSDPDERRRLERRLAARAGLESDQVLVHVPPRSVLTKPAGVRILRDDGSVSTFQEWDDRRSQRVAALGRAHARLWRIAVYVDPQVRRSDTRLDLLAAAAESQIGLPNRYDARERLDPYFAELFDRHAVAKCWPLELRAPVVREATLMRAAATEGASHSSDSMDAGIAMLELAVDRAVDGLDRADD